MLWHIWMLIFKDIRFKLQYFPISIQLLEFPIFCQTNCKWRNVLRCQYGVCKYLNDMNTTYICILFCVIYKSFPLTLSQKM